jgi:hypothetical protein
VLKTAALATTTLAAPFVRGAYAAGKLSFGAWDHWVPGASEVLGEMCRDSPSTPSRGWHGILCCFPHFCCSRIVQPAPRGRNWVLKTALRSVADARATEFVAGGPLQQAHAKPILQPTDMTADA